MERQNTENMSKLIPSRIINEPAFRRARREIPITILKLRSYQQIYKTRQNLPCVSGWADTNEESARSVRSWSKIQPPPQRRVRLSVSRTCSWNSVEGVWSRWPASHAFDSQISQNLFSVCLVLNGEKTFIKSTYCGGIQFLQYIVKCTYTETIDLIFLSIDARNSQI